MRGPRLSPHPLLCFPWDPSHRGNFADCQHRQYTVRCPTIIIFTLHREHQRKGEWLSSLSNLLLEDDVVDFNQHISDWCLKCALTLRSQLLSFKSRDRHWSPSYADLRINSMPLWYSVLVILWILDQAFISVQIRYENQSSKINYIKLQTKVPTSLKMWIFVIRITIYKSLTYFFEWIFIKFHIQRWPLERVYLYKFETKKTLKCFRFF